MSTDLLTRALAAFSALTLASLLTTGAAIAATGVGLRPAHLGGCKKGGCTTAPMQIKAAHVAKASAAIALTGRRY